MDIQDLGSIGEFVAAVATIGTLIYLAVQIRRSSESVRMSAEMDVSKQFAGWASLAVNNPNLSRIWDAAAEDPMSLTDDDRRQLLWFVMELLILYDAQYHIYLDGHISEKAWDAKANMLLGTIQNPVVAKWWDSGLGPFSPQFREYIDLHRSSEDLTWQFGSVAKASQLDE
jgi:hypothetical protein